MASNFIENQDQNDRVEANSEDIQLSPNAVSYLDVDAFIAAIVLSTWDNVVGPKLCHVWYGNHLDSHKMNEKCILHVANLTGRNLFDDDGEGEGIVNYKLLLLPQHDVVINCYIFRGCLENGRPTLYAFSMLLPTKNLDDFMPIYQVCETRVMEVIAKFRLFQLKEFKTAIQNIFNELKAFLLHINALFNEKLSSAIEISDTLLFKPCSREETSFLERAITSHLQTCRCSIVIGSDIDHVNLMIRTLAIFNTEKELRCSRIIQKSDEQVEQSYLPDLYLQGLLVKLEALPMDDIARSQRPTTIISLHNGEVYRTALPDQQTAITQGILSIDLTRIWTNSNVSFNLSPQMLTIVEESAWLIEEFLREIAALPYIEQIRTEYVEHFKQKVDTKTCALIEFIEAERKLHDTVNIDDIKNYLSVRRDSDLIAIFAASEYYKPGLCSWLNGQPSFRGYLPSGTNH